MVKLNVKKVTKSNVMNEAILTPQKEARLHQKSSALGIREQKVALALISLINPNDDDIRSYFLTIDELHKLTGIPKNHLHGTIVHGICSALVSTVFTLKDEAGTLFVPFFQRARYYDKTDHRIEFVFSPELRPHLLNLKGSFTTYHLNQITALSSAHAIRIYELLRQRLSLNDIKNGINKISFEIDILDLKSFLHIKVGQYSLFSNFVARVLTVSQKQLEDKTDLRFSFQPLRNGRKVIGVRFTVYQNRKSDINTVEQELLETTLPICMDNDLFETIKAIIPSISEREAILLANLYNKEMLNQALLDLYRTRLKRKIKDPLSYLKGILKKKQFVLKNQETYHYKTTVEKLSDRSWDDETHLPR